MPLASPPCRRFPVILLHLLLLGAGVRGDGPTDNLADAVRPVPPPGVVVDDAVRAELTAGATALAGEMEALRRDTKGTSLLEFLPDVQIYHKAVDWALRHNEFFKSNEVAVARAFLRQGSERARALRGGQAPWTTQTGLVARGYRSRIDGSIQPYGLVVPAGVATDPARPRRLDFWLHGRGETLSELAFVDQVQRTPAPFTPPDTIVLQLYGRYCNANKLAGEIDLFEALASARRTLAIDPDRLVVRGFSMGGAGCWQFAVHYPGFFCAAAPGAGFSETPDFLRVFQKETLNPSWYEKKLWHLYDCPDYAANLHNLPVVAYSGEVDTQKQAADLMEKALESEGMRLTHLIGPKTAHKYEEGSKVEISRRIDALAARGRDPLPRRVRFTTWTLRYNQSHWVRVDGLDEHWEQARVEAELDDATATFRVATTNVTALTLQLEPGIYPFGPARRPVVVLDGERLEGPLPTTDLAWSASFRRAEGRWVAGQGTADGVLAKRHGLQGPIDDAFLDAFLMVRPTGKPMNEKTGAWVAAEQAHAIDHWRRQFRGDAPVIDDTAVTDADIATHNLILWGDPSSNAVLARIADRLPLRWDASAVRAESAAYNASHHVAVLVYPNPLNPSRYVVLNSGFTFREYDYLNNARQVPKLPDWAVVDIDQPRTARQPGGIADAGFFDEQWGWGGVSVLP